MDADGRLGVYFETASGIVPIKITSSDVNVPVNIAGTTNPVPVSFTGTIPVNISGVTGTLPVSFSGTLPVSIASTLNMNLVSVTGTLPVNINSVTSPLPITLSGVSAANPVPVSISTNPVPVNITHSVMTQPREYPTFIVSATNIILGNNKSLLSLHNASASLIYKVQEVWLINALTTAVTGLVCNFELRRLAGNAPTGGTDLSTSGLETFDTSDATIPLTSFTARSGGTVAGESTKLLYRALWSSDEWGTGSSDVESHAHTQQSLMPLWSRKDPNLRPIVLRQNQGVTIKCATNTILGLWDVFATVTLES
jgi:hypothetical protein